MRAPLVSMSVSVKPGMMSMTVPWRSLILQCFARRMSACGRRRRLLRRPGVTDGNDLNPYKEIRYYLLLLRFLWTIECPVALVLKGLCGLGLYEECDNLRIFL